MSDPTVPGLTDAELAEHSAEPLPPREQMSLVAPGSAGLTPAAEALPIEAKEWHGDPDDVHVL